MRKLSGSSEYLHSAAKAVGEWLDFDWDITEFEAWEKCLAVGDKTQIEWVELNHDLSLGPYYFAGEWMGVGALKCLHCGRLEHFDHLRLILNCKKCKGKKFIRISEKTN